MIRAAQLHSLTCFLNTLFREWPHFTVETDARGANLSIALLNGQELLFPLRRWSRLGRHEYRGDIFLKNGGDRADIEFHEMIDILCDHLKTTWPTTAAKISTFKTRVLESDAIVQDLLLTRAPSLHDLASRPFSFIETEQALLIGHNFHPSPKSRDQFSADDSRRYAPEYGASFSLQWLWVKNEILFQRVAKKHGDPRWTFSLAQADVLDGALPSGMDLHDSTLMPMHPWQWNVLRKQAPIDSYIRDGKIVAVEASTSSSWQATSSLRSIYAAHAPYMLKFSMSLRLTNSIRHLQPEEVERGVQVAEVLATGKGEEFLRHSPQFQVLREPAYMAIVDVEGKILPETMVVCRENPFTGENAGDKMLLATLLQDPLLGGTSHIEQLYMRSPAPVEKSAWALKWLDDYLKIAVRPLLEAQGNYGILLGAHQQNLILEIKNGFPVRAFFRDCQGSGYSELGHSLFASEVDSITRENGNVLDMEMGNALFIYYLFVNSTLNVIASLAATGWISEDALISRLQQALVQWRQEGLRDGSCIRDLLGNATLMNKGNFFCSFSDINENTEANPFAVYKPMTNFLQITAKAKEGVPHVEQSHFI